MHELSIAVNISDIITEELHKAGASTVVEFDLEIGSLAGVVPEALEFALEEAFKDSPIAGSRINLHIIRAKAICNQCHTEFDAEQLYDLCPFCQSFDHQLICGQELKISRLIVS